MALKTKKLKSLFDLLIAFVFVNVGISINVHTVYLSRSVRYRFYLIFSAKTTDKVAPKFNPLFRLNALLQIYR